MCYIEVNETEVEFDYYLTLANLLDQGYPTLPHIHEEHLLLGPLDMKQSTSSSPEESGEDEACKG